MKLLLIYFLFFTHSKASSWDNLTANIAVVEYHPLPHNPNQPIAELVKQNAQKYIEIIEAINDTKLDLIIFPEATLRNNPDTAVDFKMDNPCKLDSYPQFFRDLSCAALKSQTYLVINLVERFKCNPNEQSPNCKNKGFYFYNTNVIFDRNGTIINRYRKFNLFGEHDLDKPKTAKKIVFGTDFGIKFGIFTCFDILFKSPAQDLLDENIDGIIFPSWWFSELPFLTALQTQQMWAYSHDITLFGAGANLPTGGTGGTGIYRGSKGTVLEGFVAQSGSKTFIYRSKKGKVQPVPHETVDALAKEMDQFEILIDPSITEFKATILDTSLQNTKTQICFGDEKNPFCCNFTLRVSKVQDLDPNFYSYTYFLVAFSGIRSFRGMYNAGIELCAVISCLNSSLSSCGQRFPKYEKIQWPVTFEGITISANFEKNENKTQFPNSLLSSIRPIDAKETLWTKNGIKEKGGEFIRRSFSLRKPQSRLLTFAIYGRDSGRDFPPRHSGGGSWTVTTILLGCAGFLAVLSKL